MYEDLPNEKDASYISENDRVLAWTKDVADCTADEASKSTSQAPYPEARHVEREPPRVVINQVVTTPAVVISRVRPQSTPKAKDEISTKAVIGTVLGATAGAVVAYAMTKSQNETPPVEQQQRVTYRTIEAPATYELVQPGNNSHVREYIKANSKSSHHAIVAPPPRPRPYVDDLNPQSEYSHHAPRSGTRSFVEGVTSPPTVTKISVADSGNSRAPHTSLPGKTARQSDLTAKDVPLPHSRVTITATEEREMGKEGKSSVSPKESVSQVSIRWSGENGRSKHHGGRDPGKGRDDERGDHRSRTSKRRREQ